MKQLAILLITCTLFSCDTPDTATVVTRLPAVDTLHSRPIPISESVVLSPSNMCMTGDRLVVYSEGKDTLFDIFRMPDGEWVGHGGLSGRGPGDFTLLERSLMAPTDNGFTVAMTDRLADVSVADDQIRIVRSRPLFNASFQHLFANRLRPIDDSMCFYLNDALSATDGMQFTLLNLNTLECSRFSPWPRHWLSGEIAAGTETSAFVCNPVTRPDGERFAVFYVLFKRFRIFKADGTLLHDIAVEEPPFGNRFTTDYSVPLRYYYDYPQATEDYIYVTCLNAGDEWTDRPDVELQVWDWNGTPVARYLLDRNIALTALPESGDRLYGMSYDGQLYVYDLPPHN